jgi:hypothetical protein
VGRLARPRGAGSPVGGRIRELPATVTTMFCSTLRLAAAVLAAFVPVGAAAAQLSHNVLPNNGLSSGASVYFDLDVLDPNGIDVHGLTVFTGSVNTPFQLLVSLRAGSHVGHEGNPVGWSLATSAAAVSAGALLQMAPVVFGAPVHLPPGQHGVKLQYLGVGPRYRTLSVRETVSAAGVDLTVGSSRSTTMADPWAGTNNSPRGFSGVIDVHGSGVHPAAVTSYGEHGTTSQGTAVQLDADDVLLAGTSTLTWVSGPAPSLSALLVGFQREAIELGNVLQQVGVLFGQVLVVEATQASTTWSQTFPNDPSWLGADLHWQAAVLDPGLAPLPATFSNGVTTRVGNVAALAGEELDVEFDPGEQNLVPCGPGETRYLVRGWRRQTRGRGAQSVEVRHAGAVIADESVAPGCVRGTIYTDLFRGCLPTNPALQLVWQDCDAGPQVRSVPAGSVNIGGFPPPVMVGNQGNLTLVAPGAWLQGAWSSSRPDVISITLGTWRAHRAGRTRITFRGLVQTPEGVVRVHTSRWVDVQ